MYKDKRFKIRPLADIFQDIDEAGRRLGGRVKTLFLPDGNTILIKTASLVQILARARQQLPNLERITMYGSARFINRKGPEEWRSLAEAGLSRVHMGLESGDDVTLARMNKGATAEEMIAAGRAVRRAGIELSVYYLVGLGGTERWAEHARASAEAINAMAPDFIRLRTLVPVPNAPLFQDVENKRFQPADPKVILDELQVLVDNLGVNANLVSDHVSNYLNLSGRLPEDRPELLAEINAAIQRGPEKMSRRVHRL
jgi:radical SAM superfamily enzyme YgiQ (UPF0313 family)